MGAVNSSNDDNDDFTFDDEDDDKKDSSYEADPDIETLLDLSKLFDVESLRKSLEAVVKDTTDNKLVEHRDALIEWLEEKQSHEHQTISYSQFCEYLESKGVARTRSYQLFQAFDTDEEGVVDITFLIDSLKKSQSMTNRNLDSVTRSLQSCVHTPGLIDIYNEDKPGIRKHACKLLKYLLKNRVPGSGLMFSSLSGFSNTVQMRQSCVESNFNLMQNIRSGGVCGWSEVEGNLAKLAYFVYKKKAERSESLESGQAAERQIVTKCVKDFSVSSSTDNAQKLFDEVDPYWQSDGSARSHFIRLKIKKDVIVKKLSVGVLSSDQSYMPQHIVVSVSKSTSGERMRDVKDIRIPAHYNGDFILLENAKVHYPVIQINIRRCHNDGCDCRIHGVKIVGYRLQHETEVSVVDTMATWYIQILSSTTAACLPASDQLRANVLHHCRNALSRMKPLCLSAASSERPACVSPLVLTEIGSFLNSVTSIGSDEKMMREGLPLLLMFHLAQGHIIGTLETLQKIHEQKIEELDVSSLLKNIDTVRDAFWRRRGTQLKLDLMNGGGDKNQESGLTRQNSSSAYIPVANFSSPDEGSSQTNLIFKCTEPFQLTKIHVKLSKSSKEPSAGMIFIYIFDEEQMTEVNIDSCKSQFQKFDKWKKSDIDAYINRTDKKNLTQEKDTFSVPIASFFFSEDKEEVDIHPVEHRVGRCALVKYISLTPSESSCSINLKFFGLERKAGMTEDLVHASTFSSEGCASNACDTRTVVLKILSFLVGIVRDQATKKTRSTADLLKCSLINFTGINIGILWEAFRTFQTSVSCQRLMFLLTHELLPYIVASRSSSSKSDIRTEEFFQHLSSLVDNESASGDCDKQTINLASQIITDGAGVFFCEKEARQKKFYFLMTDVTKTETATSVSLTFKSLCQFFGWDPSGLLDLPTSAQQKLDVEGVMTVVDTLVSVAYRDCVACIESMKQSDDKSGHLVRLISLLQTKLMFWCQAQLNGSYAERNTDVLRLLEQYVKLVSTKVSAVFELFADKTSDDVTSIVERLENTFIATTLPQLVLLLSNLCHSLSSPVRNKILYSLQPLVKCLQNVSNKLPQLFHAMDSPFWSVKSSEEKILRTWELESSHNYENGLDFTQVFSCPGAAVFIVTFDPRCETERRYDYLEFTDSNGKKTRYDHKTNTEVWPLTVNFSGGPRLHFHFHSDCSNSEWGYKFKVTAKGTSDVSMHWLFDLHICVAKLVGRLCGNTLNINTDLDNSEGDDIKYKAEQELLHSDLWMTLFRAGYSTGKLQRSLSGKHESDEDYATLTLLCDVRERQDELTKTFLQKLEDQYAGNRGFGGSEVDDVVLLTFSALIWHTQSLREDVSKYVKSNGKEKLSDGIHQAFSTAEGLRHYLVEQRQRYKVGVESGSSEAGLVDPVPVVCEKAQFLTKFAGLSKVQLRSEIKSKMYNRSSSRIYSRRTSNSMASPVESVFEKYPTFRLVMDFIKDPAWSTRRVEQMLKQRAEQAQALSDSYAHLTKYLQLYTSGDIFQISNMVMLQELLHHQSSGHTLHYVDGLEGCGLELETRVRQSFYDLLRLLVNSVRSKNRVDLTKSLAECFDFIRICILHLCDVMWQVYDLPFLQELQLPELFHSFVIGTVPTREYSVIAEDDEGEREEFKQFSQWLDEVKEFSMNGWIDMHANDPKKMTQAFIARYSDILEVQIMCDGCLASLSGRRYRCLDCVDLDLCATCYAGGIVPSGEHEENHRMTHLQFKCDGCRGFIVGSRLHCEDCEDFDLCLSCQITSNYPSRHKPDHNITKIALPITRMKEHSYSLLQSYCHQHAWLLFSSLTLSVASFIYSKTPDISSDADYASAANNLHAQSIKLLTKFFSSTSTESNDNMVDVKVKEKKEGEGGEGQEESFLMHEQMRIMGLLGAMIPDMNDQYKSSLMEDIGRSFITEEFVSMLFKLARGERAQDSTTPHLSLGLLNQLLQRVPPDYKIVTLSELSESEMSGSESDTSSSTDEFRSLPLRTLHYFFRFGAAYLEKSGLDHAGPVASILQKLSVAPAWKPAFQSYVAECLQKMKKDSSLLSIFSLCVVAGLPEVPRLGTYVTYTDASKEQRQGFIVKKASDKNEAVVVDKKTRRHKLVDNNSLDIVHKEICSVDESHVSSIIGLIKDLSSKQDDVKTLWTLALLMKALLRFTQTSGTAHAEMFEQSFVQCVIQWASAGTGFNKLWLASDLEILSLMLYTRRGSQKSREEKKRESMSAEVAGSGSEVTHESSAVKVKHDSLEGIDDDMAEIFRDLQRQFNIGLPLIRETYDSSGRAIDTLPEKIRKLRDAQLKKSTSRTDYTIDVGTKLSSKPECGRSVEIPEEAQEEEESVEEAQLITSPGSDVQSLTRQCKIASHTLLQEKLDESSAEDAAQLLIKVNRAMAILYARQVLTALLADWPELGQQVMTDLLGCETEANLPFVLELLNQAESNESFLKVVRNVVKHCHSDSLTSIAEISCSFMGEMNLASVTVESLHHATRNSDAIMEDKVHIQGATFLTVQFDSRCGTEEDFEELVIASDPEYTIEKHSYSGTNSLWTGFDIPGDTLYYKFSGDSESNAWGFKFTVTGGRLGHFDTGYLILSELLLSDFFVRAVRVDDLWRNLISVSCRQVGQRRLKTLRLILIVMQSFLSKENIEGDHPVDLGLLRPLWTLYRRLGVTLEDTTASLPLPSIARALTELFYVAETLAVKWNVTRAYQLSLLDNEDIQDILIKGFEMVAVVSVGAGLQNSAVFSLMQRIWQTNTNSAASYDQKSPHTSQSGGRNRQQGRRIRRQGARYSRGNLRQSRMAY